MPPSAIAAEGGSLLSRPIKGVNVTISTVGYFSGGMVGTAPLSAHILQFPIASSYPPVDVTDLVWASTPMKFYSQPYVEPETRITINPKTPSTNPTGYRARKAKARKNNGLPNGS